MSYLKSFLIEKNTPKATLLVLTLIYWAVSYIIFDRVGIRVVSDSPRYLSYASNLGNGFYIDDHNFWYFGYVAFIFSIKQFFSSNEAIILLQYLLGYGAVLLLYKTSCLFLKDRLTGFITAIIYIVFLEPIFWQSFILAEAIYASVIVIVFYFFAKSLHGRSKGSNIA